MVNVLAKMLAGLKLVLSILYGGMVLEIIYKNLIN